VPPARTAPATGRITIVDWRSWPDRVTVLWRRSLRFRTVVLTLALSALAIVIACVWMALAIQSDLLESRQQQVLEDARRATSEVQRTLDSAEPRGAPRSCRP
jgi:two-component system sensor histidine kinase MtrB